MQKFQVADLIPHPQNALYFDDMTGEKWEEFKESVRTSGIIEPPVVTTEKIIVSGHQRIRACKELGIEEIYCEMRGYDSEDKVLKDLIETNIRQRGTITGSAKKMGLIYDELKRIYGVKHGNNQRTPQNAESSKTQEDIAGMMGKSVDTLERFAALKDLIPEFQTILDEKRISASTASSIVAKLTEEEQMQLFNKLPSVAKITQAQVQAEVDKIKSDYEEKLTDAEDRLVEAQEAQALNLPDEEYTQVAQERDDAKEQCRMWYEQRQEANKEIKTLQTQLKAKEQEASDLARRLEKAVQKQDTKEDEEAQIIAAQTKRIVSMNIDPEKYALGEAQRLQAEVSAFSNMLNTFIALPDVTRRMPDKYKQLILTQGEEAIERLQQVFTYLKEEGDAVCKIA